MARLGGRAINPGMESGRRFFCVLVCMSGGGVRGNWGRIEETRMEESAGPWN
jgi:hypothetical protein